MTASDSGWQPPGFLKANITAKDELQVCQACKHALITHFPADDNEVAEIAAALSGGGCSGRRLVPAGAFKGSSTSLADRVGALLRRASRLQRGSTCLRRSCSVYERGKGGKQFPPPP